MKNYIISYDIGDISLHMIILFKKFGHSAINQKNVSPFPFWEYLKTMIFATNKRQKTNTLYLVIINFFHCLVLMINLCLFVVVVVLFFSAVKHGKKSTLFTMIMVQLVSINVKRLYLAKSFQLDPRMMLLLCQIFQCWVPPHKVNTQLGKLNKEIIIEKKTNESCIYKKESLLIDG